MDSAAGLSVLNPWPQSVSKPALLHDLVRPASEDIALEHLSRGDTIKFSYKSLHEAADALASQITLLCDSVQGQLIVPVLLPQSPDLYITLLAILKAGGAFCPLNLDAPTERVQFILKDVGAKVVITSPDLSSNIPADAGVAILHATDSYEFVGQNHQVATRKLTPESYAYVMYTSGSTGTPKGVSISHSAATQALLAHDAHIPSFSRFFQFAAPTFDVSVFEIFFPLVRGRTLISARRQETLDDLPSVLRHMNVDACELTPTVAASLLRKRENAPKLKLLMTIGEMLNPLVVKEFGGSKERDSILWAMYGPTEATIHCTLQSNFQSESSTGNIGVPLETVSCFIIKPATDEADSTNFELLPLGDVGELAVGGEQLASGYLNDERKTKNAFIDSPYGRVYRTGDKAKLNTDGTLECLGRISDGQVKLRGQRIELGEIEHAILKTTGCHGATARVIGAILVAFCAVDDQVSEDDIISSCNQWLPRFMIPGEVVLLEELPRLPSGKVNAKELQRQFEQSKSQTGQTGDFNNTLEPGLLQILEKYFGSQLSPEMELARAGLDSLTAIGLSSSLRQAGYDTNAVSLLKMKNIGNIVSSIATISEAERAYDAGSVSVSCLGMLEHIKSDELTHEMTRRKIYDIVPCSNLQIAMLSETSRNVEAYWNTVELQVFSSAPITEIENAIHTIIRANEILRTGFVQHESTFYSIIFDDISTNSITCLNTDGLETVSRRTANWLNPLQIEIRADLARNSYGIHLHLHHAIYDGWSLDLLRADIAKIISGGVLPKRSQFTDVLAFSTSEDCEQYDERAKVFWADYLFGWNKPPFPRLIPRVMYSAKVRSRTYTYSLPKLSNQSYTGSAQVPFQAALSLVWGGILGLQDVVIGSVTSGRTIPVKGVENIMGPCISSLPLRVNMEQMATVDDLVNSIASSNRQMMEHSTLSQLAIKKIANMYGSEQLYDVLFVYQESLEQRQQMDSLVKEIGHLDKVETKLVLEVQPAHESFVLQATFHEDHFSSDLVQTLLSQVAELSSVIIENPHSPLTTLRSLNSGTSTYNMALEKMSRPSSPENLAALVQQAAVLFADRPSISFATQISASTFETTSITYDDLNSRANRIAHFLLSQNVKAGEVVPIIMHKSIRLYTAILGIIKAGCGYLPLLPSTPNARILEIFTQSQSRLCLADEHSVRDIPASSTMHTVLIDEESMQEYSSDYPSVNIESSSAAYVIYTSGTTGTPKGVTVSHKNIASNVTYLGVEYPEALNGPSNFLQACSQAFDVSVFEIFFAWHKGMCLCAATNDVLFADIEETIRKFEITHLSLTPTIASLIDPVNVPSVEFLVTAGEPMTNAVNERWNKLLWQGYGPSETTNICSVKKMSPDDYIEHLGLVFDNTSVVVLEPKALSTLPIGWAGEFCFGGDQVATGYLNMPRLTAEKFFQHPTYGRLYRSGDFGRMLPDGSLVILGRIDDQVKLRGQRIEAAEINGIVSRISSATAAVTLVLKQKDSMGEWLATFYVQQASSENFEVLDADTATQGRVFAELHTKLLSYMVPSYLIPVSCIPLTPSGKVDKRVINTTFSQLSKEYLKTVAHNTAKEDDEDWSDAEHAVATLMADSLHVSRDDIGRWTPLAIMGLDSLSAIQVSRSLTREFKSTVSISTILQHPTVAQLAKKLCSSRGSDDVDDAHEYFDQSFLTSVKDALAREDKEVVEILPCSPLQEAMVSRGKTNYYNKSLLRLRVDPDKMQGYWQHMCERHSILRTCFVSTNSATYPIAQVSLSKWQLPWHEFIVTQPSLEAAIQDHLALVPEPLDTNTPPLSLALIRYGETKFLSFICHHALYDGVAMECLWREVEALARGEELKPPIAHGPFIHEILKLPADNQAFWKQQFSNFQPSLLFRKPHGRAVRQVTHTLTVERSLRRSQQKIKSLGISLSSLCQATMARLLAIIGDKSDVCFGNVMYGRTIGLDGIERLVAPCFNTVPIRQDMPPMLSNIDLAKSLLALNADLLERQFMPLRQIQKIAAAETRNLFDALLLVQQPLQEMDVNTWTLEEDAGVMDLPLVCEVTPCPNLDSLVLDVHYDMSAVPNTLASGIAELFKHIFLQILESPHGILDKNSIPDAINDQIRFRQFHFFDDYEDEDTDDSDSAWTPEELAVRTVFADLSQTNFKNIEKTTSLFKLGLDSINAVQIAAILRQQDYSISSSDVIECQNCLKITKRIFENGYQPKSEQIKYDFTAFDAAVRPSLNIASDTCQVFPCTPMQSAMLSTYVSSQGVHYLNEIGLEMKNGATVSLIAEKWNALVADHSMLRTGFVPVRHADCSYAMILHETVQSKQISLFGIGDFDLTSWKEIASNEIKADLALPPWRLAIAKVDGVANIHLIIHHALYDATSLQEMMSNFAKVLNGQDLRPVADIQDGLSAVLQRSAGEMEDASAFWRTLGEQATINRFPLLTPLREAKREVLVEEASSVLTSSDLHQLTKSLGISVQTAILASWTRLLAGYTGEEAVVFGVTFSGRTCEATLSTSIPCLITVPVVAENVGSNKDLLDQVMASVSDIHQHQFLPLSRIQKEMGHPATPVFDTLVAYQKIEADTNERPWIQKQDNAAVEFPVSLEVEPLKGGSICLRLTYLSDILPSNQAKLLLQQFDATMEDLLINPDGHQHDLHMHRPEVFSISPPLEPIMEAPVELLYQFVELQANINPDNIALEHVSGFQGNKPIRAQWTFSQFNDIGNKVANMLSERTKAGSIIAIHFDKCPEAYFAILGILKSGSAFVALDFNAPNARKEFILQDSKAPCLLTSKDTVIDFEVPCPVIVIDDALLERYPETSCTINGVLSPSNTCYCLYTSGTTGTPKGCEITHENTVQCMMAFQDLFRGHWADDSRWLQFAALHFDVSVLEQYWSWSVGMTVVAAKKDLILDDLIGFINNAEITHIDLTPSLARLTHPDTVPGLCRGVFITGGEQLKQEILDAWGSKAVIYNAYGPTEATIGVTTYQRVPQNGRPSNIGRQFRNVGSYVFHKDTEIPVLRGAVGELCVSGKLVGKGYLNRPELTDEKFPTLKAFGERIYRTGDLVRILHDGCFEFLGRADDQVKLRGQRLELGEIDHVIRSVKNIHDVTTLVTKHTSSGKDVLVSFIVEDPMKDVQLAVLEDGNGVGTDARNICRDKLPGYMVPSYFLKLPYIPLSPNNKAEAKQLKKLFAEISQEDLVRFGSATVKRNISCDSPAYQKLISCIAEFCHVDAAMVTESSSIFDFGVDSITALSLSAFLTENGVPTASPALILRNPIVADLAAALSATSAHNTAAELKRTRQHVQAFEHKHKVRICRDMSIAPSDIEYIYPCSPLQQGMLAKAAIEAVEGLYFNVFNLCLKPDTSVSAFKEAITSLFERESILRTSFSLTSSGYVQVARHNVQLPWKECTLAENETFEQATQSSRQNWIAENSESLQCPFKITMMSGKDAKMAIIHIFHGLYDGTSFDLMMNRLAMLYNGVKVQIAPSFADALVHGPLKSHDNAKAAWASHLEHWSPSVVTLDGDERSPLPISSTRKRTLSDLEQLRSSSNVTMQSLLLAAWVTALQHHSRGNVTTGVIASGRSIALPGVEHTVGPLFNTIPFCANLTAASTWKSVLQRCQDFNAMVLEDPHVPLQQIQKWASNGKPLFETLFAYQIEGSSKDDDILPWEIENGGLNPDYPLAFEVTRGNGTMQLLLVAKGDLTNEKQLDAILDTFETMLASIEANTSIPLELESTLPNTEKGERAEASHREEQSLGPNAEVLLSEIASLSNIPSSDINPSTTWLELGLDSIDAVQLSARLKKHGLVASPSAIMKAPSLAALSSSLTELISGHALNEVDLLKDMKSNLRHYVERTGLDMTQINDILPTTPLQDAMVSGMIESNFTWYFNHEVLEVAPSINVDKLQAAWSKLFEASPILRTGFVELSDPQAPAVYAQVVYNSFPEISHVSLNSLDELHTIQEQSRAAAAESTAKADLARVVCATCGEKTFFVLSISHALYDGWSLGLIHEDLRALYAGETLSRPSPDQFLLRSSLSLTPEAEGFWGNYLEGARQTNVPQAEPSPSNVVRAETISTISLDTVNKFCREQKISLQSLCQACWAIILARRTRSLDVVFGSILSGRDFDGAEDLMFPTMNTVAIRAILHGSISAFLQYMEENLGDLRSNQMFPLRKAIKAAKVAGKNLFNSLFLLQKTPATSNVESLFQSVDGSSGVDYPVCVEAAASGESLEWTVACQGQFKDASFTDELLGELDATLKYLLGHSNEDVVVFSDTGVRVCGSVPVVLSDDDNDFSPASINAAHEWNATSLAIREVLSQVSNIPEESIDASSNLYHLGLDSITAIKVSSLLKQKGIFLRPTEMVRADNIMQMAEHANAVQISPSLSTEADWQSWTPAGTFDVAAMLAEAGIVTEEVEHILPALPMQVYMMSTWQNTSGKIFFPEFKYLVSGSHTSTEISEAWRTVVKQLPMLRTCLFATGQKDLPFVQVILKFDSSYSGMQPFVHLSIDQNPEVPHTMLRLRIHHALYDGVSLPAIMDTLLRELRGTPSDKTKIDTWAQQAIICQDEKHHALRKTFWTNYLDGYKESVQDIDTAGPRTSLFEEAAYSKAAILGEVAASHGISVQSLALAAYALSIPCQQSFDSIIFGIYLANRSNEDIPDTLPTLNLVPLRVFVNTDETIVQIAQRIHNDMHQISSDGNAQVGLWEIAQWTGIKVDRFVNFLTLPAAEDIDDKSDVTLRPVSNNVITVGDEAAPTNSEAELASVRNNASRDAYPDSVDVEFAVRNGHLDIGVFGPQAIITDQGANELLHQIVERLNTI
ncbi:hypothetical protein NLG97_g4473 [Lecanicillium saksenae]|uniref:Uncharacterized protein n=1 Tax=Lecanicillium saksenae TaxID=468837 RepID=A0ACC1QV79_9HYPO|nr:hypothetical protein NLG97_g4473 [Lecanicillium saksenae]